MDPAGVAGSIYRLLLSPPLIVCLSPTSSTLRLVPEVHVPVRPEGRLVPLADGSGDLVRPPCGDVDERVQGQSHQVLVDLGVYLVNQLVALGRIQLLVRLLHEGVQLLVTVADLVGTGVLVPRGRDLPAQVAVDGRAR